MTVCIVMGVAGSGKSTVAEALARKCGGVYVDADDFHSAANKAKMASGEPLNDDDRWDWLSRLNLELRRLSADHCEVFLACSALRESYRERLAAGLLDVRLLYLKGSEACISGRLAARTQHFMNPALLESQFKTLEEPKDAAIVDIEAPLAEVIDRALRACSLPRSRLGDAHKV